MKAKNTIPRRGAMVMMMCPLKNVPLPVQVGPFGYRFAGRFRRARRTLDDLFTVARQMTKYGQKKKEIYIDRDSITGDIEYFKGIVQV